MEKRDNNSLSYLPQLDALRALAVLLVIISHWFPKDHLLNIYTPNGFLGVTIFFVLSGFLITRILLNYRSLADKEGIPRTYFLKLFYIRRSIRIFPVYFLVLFFVALLNIDNIRSVIGWHITYTSNFLFFFQGMGNVASHLWTLAVEEQFYFFWPFIILFVPRKFLLPVIFSFIIVAPLFRIIVDTISPSRYINILTPSCFDAFGLGALFAYSGQTIHSYLSRHFKKLVWLLFLLSSFFMLYIALTLSPAENIFLRKEMIAFGRLGFSAIALFAIYYTSKENGIKGMYKKMIESPVILYIGKISYSLYLFHYFLPYLLKYFGLHLPFSHINVSIQFLILFLLSTVSWYLIEKPANKLKKHFREKPTLGKEESITAIP